VKVMVEVAVGEAATRGRKHLQSESSFRDISANLLTGLQNFVSFARDHRFFSQELPIFSG
jgi:hypothetical protein